MRSGCKIPSDDSSRKVHRDWYQYVVNSGMESPLPVLRSMFDFYSPLYAKICRHAKSGSRLLEVGAGTAIFGMWLACAGYEVTQIDSDERVVRLALENADRLNVPRERYKVLLADGTRVAEVFSCDAFDLSYSRGLLEHLPEVDAVRLLRAMGTVSAKVVSIVPGKHMKVPRVDERPFTMGKLGELHQKAGLKLIERFSFGDEPRWLCLYVPPIVRYALRRHFEIGSEVGVVCLSNRCVQS